MHDPVFFYLRFDPDSFVKSGSDPFTLLRKGSMIQYFPIKLNLVSLQMQAMIERAVAKILFSLQSDFFAAKGNFPLGWLSCFAPFSRQPPFHP